MGQQQMFLIIVSIIIIATAIAVGILLFSSNSIAANREAIINNLSNIAVNAYQYRLRPWTIGGGSGKYNGYIIPMKLSKNEDGLFSTSVNSGIIVLRGESSMGFGTVQAVLDSSGRLSRFTFTGEFN